MAEEGGDRKATLVSSLLQDNNAIGTGIGKKKLIEEILPADVSRSEGKEDCSEDTSGRRKESLLPSENEKNSTVMASTEEVSLMDLMLAAHQEAKQTSEIMKTKERIQESKKFGGGFKKGFLGGGGGGGKSKSSEKKKPSKPLTSPQSPSSLEEIPTIKPSPVASSPLVMSDVQEAMKEESNPLLKQIQQGDWATPDLMNQLQDNPILSNGLKNPKCLAALQLLQTNPKEAQDKFKNDSDVSFFLQEFSRVMSQHFFALGNQQQQQQGQGQAQQTQVPSTSSSSASRIQEIGPLHAEALARQKSQQQPSASGNIITTTTAADSQCSDEQVKQVLENEELRSLLMDPGLQQILKECNDPVRFQHHMRDPITARKIKKLYEAGLVGTTK